MKGRRVQLENVLEREVPPGRGMELATELATGKSPAPAGWKACPTSEPERFREPAFTNSVKMHPSVCRPVINDCLEREES
jgi:hypothetical protein